MATNLTLPPPEPLEIYKNAPANWKKFKQKWTNFARATGVNEEQDDKQVATLLTIIGDDALTEYNKFNWTKAGDENKIKIVIQKFEDFCKQKTNIIYQRYMFNTSTQSEGESIEQYVTKLRTLAEHCDYGDLEESLIRDRVVLGLRTVKLRERLLKKSDLTLQTAIEEINVYEATRKQMKKIEENSADKSIHAMKKFDTRRKSQTQYASTRRKPQSYDARRKFKSQFQKTEEGCSRCGRPQHKEGNKCPAMGKRCNKCGGMNHFYDQCRTKKSTGRVKQFEEVDEETDEYEDDYDEICACRSKKDEKQVYATMEIGSKRRRRKFQIDTGASCNVMSFQDLDNESKSMIEPSNKDEELKMYNQSKMRPLGHTKLKVRNPANGKKYLMTVTVIKEPYKPIIGKKAAEYMGLVEIKYENIQLVEAANQILEEYTDVFDGLGHLPGQYKIQVDKTVPPVAQPPRRVPAALRKPLKDKLDELEQKGIISPIKKHTQWVSSVVIVHKKDKKDKLRICLDPKPLNKAIKRPHYQLPTIEDVATRLTDAKVFSVLDAKDGFWQVELDQESAELTTFHTPFGRYYWNRLPFGLCSAPEEFQRRIHEALEGLEGVEVIADDILVIGRGSDMDTAIKDHDQNLTKLLERARERQLKLNKDKVKLRLTEVSYIGHLLTSNGLKPDPKKIEAIVNMPTPTDLPALKRFLGMVNYLSKFLPNLSTTTECLRKLEEKDVVFVWEEQHDKAISKIKSLITSEPVLRYYNVAEQVTLQCDASQSGLGATILQSGQPIAFASRALTETEQRYAQIEKEMLAIVYGCERFDQYLYGQTVKVESDHKPLETIMKKPLYKAPKRLQGMMMRLQKYNLQVTYKPGRHMYIADTLSRAYLNTDTEDSNYGEVRQFEEMNILKYLPISEERLKEIKEKTREDKTLQKLQNVIKTGWPEKNTVPNEIKPYYNFREEMVVVDDIIFKGNRVVIPHDLIPDMKNRIHASHLGQETCLRKAREAVYWVNMNKDMIDYISKCSVCSAKPTAQSKEELQSHEVPDRPWSKVGTDLFEIDGRKYVIIVDYYSNYWEVDYLSEATADIVIGKMKSQFARHGIPDIVISDNGPPYSSSKFEEFAKKWEFKHITSSPAYPQSNGKAESAVKTAKHLLMKAKASKSDPYLAMLDYRNSPTQGSETSPVQKLMSRRTKTLLPTASKLLKPKVTKAVNKEIQNNQQRQQKYYNQGAKNLKPLNVGDRVRVQPIGHNKKWKPATVKKKLNFKSYEVQTDQGQLLRRNRRHLKKTQESQQDDDDPDLDSSSSFKPDTENNTAPQIPAAARQDQDLNSPQQKKFSRFGREIKTRKPLDL